MKNTKAQKIFTILQGLYPDARCALVHNSAWQLLVATMLSAQCTDARVNQVTAELFAKYPEIENIDSLPLADLKKFIYSTGFYNNKAKNIKGAARKIIADFNGKVPDTMEKLLTVPGVARKTANVVLSVWFRKNQGIVVDTHVSRLAQRLGLTTETKPEKIETELEKLFARKDWERIATYLVFHGRNVCFARKPDCRGCALNKICPGAFKFS